MLLSTFHKTVKCILQPVASVSRNVNHRSITTGGFPLNFQITDCLYAEPLKKKRRLDPAILRAREERRRRKLEKQIRKMEKQPRQLKPIEECEIPQVLVRDEKNVRSRPLPQLTAEELDERVLILKKWSAYRLKQHLADVQMIDRILFAQQKALDELRNESEELYQEAIQIDPNLIPRTLKGPVLTPKIPEYDPPDGEYIDTSKKW